LRARRDGSCILIGPFRDHQQAVSPAALCRRYSRCLVCRVRPAQLHQEFFALVRESWSPAEMNLLTKAANSALL
jgi:hypothetical protein